MRFFASRTLPAVLLLVQRGVCSVLFAERAEVLGVNTNVARQTRQCQSRQAQEHHGVVNGSGSYWQYQTFKSSPYNPPKLQITTKGGALSPGFILIAPSDTNPLNPPVTKNPAPMIMTDKGQLVWIGPVGPATVTNLHVTQFDGKPALIYWTGVTYVGPTFGHGWGSIKLLDNSYNEILDFCPKVGLVTHNSTTYKCEVDVHESLVTSRNNILWVAYNVTQTDLTSVNGPKDGWVYDNIIYETNPRTGEHLFRWSSLDHVPVNSTRIPTTGLGTNQSTPLGYFQTNGITEAGPDAYLVCSRHTSSIFLLDRKTGAVRWTLSGVTGGDFGPLASEAKFNWQHDARASAITQESMVLSFLNNDNARFDPVTRPSRVMRMLLRYPARGRWTVEVLSDVFDVAKPLTSQSQGSVMSMANGNLIVGYGVTPVMREFGPAKTGTKNRDLRWEARFGVDNAVQQYRYWKQDWHAVPAKTKPSLFIEKGSDSCRKAYVSWNGATHVKSWKIFEGGDVRRLSVTGIVPFQGFETTFNVGGSRFVQVAAILDGGKEVRSEVFGV